MFLTPKMGSMNLWGKLYYALFVHKCLWCKSPALDRSEQCCSADCADMYERQNTY